ncbi:MAG: metallophosphoesterase [candidate division Zixibacteria bacterium]|nr:metallophosphoesterase [candidate division Zixibacteria bacterium]
MPKCFFVSDLHGQLDRYEKLFLAIAEERPEMVLLGGDLLPSALTSHSVVDTIHQDFINDFLVIGFAKLRQLMVDAYPRIMLILGNDDGRFDEASILDAATHGIWEYVHDRRLQLGIYSIYGYAYVPPTPFILKDWERYDISRYVDPGCISPEEGWRSRPVSEYEKKYATIKDNLELLVNDDNLERAIFLFHAPPHNTNLDLSPLARQNYDNAPLDPHIGSIAIRNFIETRQPLVTLHGHIHESARLSGGWQDRIGRTYSFTAAHDGPELALIRFDPEYPEQATRELI